MVTLYAEAYTLHCGRMIAIALSCECGGMVDVCAAALLFCGRMIAGALSRKLRLAPFPLALRLSVPTGRKIAIALSCECRRTAFSGAAFCLSPLFGMWVTAFAPYCLLCAAPVVANAPNGALPQTLLGLCPRPRKPLARGLTARFLMRFAVLSTSFVLSVALFFLPFCRTCIFLQYVL